MKSTTSLALKGSTLFFPLSILLFCLIFPNSLTAQTVPNNPKLGLALSGGGSKGIAQVGVLKVLEEENIRPDFITGTSIGSILGGLYAIGYSIEDLEKLTMETDWEYYFDDVLEREFFPIEERDAAERYQIRFSIDSGRVSLPKGVVRGKKISLLLSRLTIPAHGIHNFDDFDIPFRGIATDIETGHAVVYGKGDLADVMRASLSIPSVFVPFEIDGKLCIDGGVARNLPVEDAYKLGAEKVIGVDIGAPLYKRDAISSILDILDQTSSYRIVECNHAQAEMADLVIRPEIGDISALSFNQNDTLMHRGTVATLEKLEEIKAMFPREVTLKPRGVQIPEKIKVVDFEVQGCDEKQAKTVRNVLQIKKTKIYRLVEIERRIKKLYGSELVALASYRLTPMEDGYKLTIKVEPQKGEFLRLSANYDSRLKAGLLLNLTFRNRVFSASKLNLDLKISENPAIDLDYFKLTATRPNIGLHLGGRVHFYPGLTYINGSKKELFDIRHFKTSANVFSTFSNRFLISTGMGLERFVRSEEFFETKKDNLRMNQAFSQLRFLRDTYNREHFPTKGSYLQLSGKYSYGRSLKYGITDTTSSIASDNTMLRLEATKAFSFWKKVTPILALDAGYTQRAENNYLNRFYLGQSLPGERSHVEFSGLRYMEVPVSSYWMGQIKLQIEPATEFFITPVFNYAYYALESLRVIDGVISNEVISEEESIYGAGIELGMQSRLGPVVFKTEYNFGRERFNFDLHVGHTF